MLRSRGTRKIQKGGDYISTILSTVSMPSSISYSSISTIVGSAGLSSIGDWSQLTIAQINQMIGAIGQQITQDDTDITNLTSSIAAYDRMLTIDPNLQGIFNNADFIYTSTLDEYKRISSLVQEKQSTFIVDTALLSSYSTVAAGYLSSLEAARRDYSTLLSTAGQMIPLINAETSTLQQYYSTFNTLSSFCIQYSPSYTQYNGSTTTIGATVGDLQSTLTQVGLDYTSLSSLLVSTPTDTILSTNVQSVLNNMNYISSALTIQEGLYSTVATSTSLLSSMMGGCDVTLQNLGGLIQQTSTNIGLYIEISTSYSVGSSAFWSQFEYWSTLEQQANSSITAYDTERRTLISRRDILRTAIDTSTVQLRAKLSQFDINANTFYTKKQAELENEVLEFQNSTREWNAYTGLLTAQLMYKKLELYDSVDTLSFYINSTMVTGQPELKATLEGQRGTLITDQTSLQTQVDKLNPLDIKFMELDQFYTNERAYKNNFIQTRSSLTAVERNVIANPDKRDSSRTYYDDKWDTMNTTITSINTQITNRQNKWTTEIKPILDDVKAQLVVDPLSKYASSYDPFPPYYPYTFDQIPQQIKNTTTVSDYALLPAIDFNAPLAVYRL